MICHTCGRCIHCNVYVGYPCCGHAHHYCTASQWYWNGFQYVHRPFWNVHSHSHHHSHTHHHHAHNPVRHDVGSAIQALAGRK